MAKLFKIRTRSSANADKPTWCDDR